MLTLKTTSDRAFTLDDQFEFARLSGDWNPIHLDPVFARRTLAGQVVVHGMHAALWALDLWASLNPTLARLRSVKASFFKPMPIEASLRVTPASTAENAATLHVRRGTLLTATIDATWGTDDCVLADTPIGAGDPPRMRPVERSTDGMAGSRGAFPLQFDPGLAETLFPALTAVAGGAHIASLASVSRVVGVECPGLYSLLSEIDLVAEPGGTSGAVVYRVTGVDDRFRLVRLQVETPAFTGRVHAFLTPKPTAQASVNVVRQHVRRDEFAGISALIVGGSRGLGELTAKVLAAGGADVTITYLRGEADAARVVDEIADGDGTAQAMALDVLDQGTLPDSVRPDVLYYFASPFIFGGSKQHYSPELHDAFRGYYVDGFERLVEALVRRGLTRAFYPSSVALDEMPPDMREYVAAKAAGETLCEALARRFPDLYIFKPRLPRLATDQTATQMPVNNADAFPVMLTLIREFHARR